MNWHLALEFPAKIGINVVTDFGGLLFLAQFYITVFWFSMVSGNLWKTVLKGKQRRKNTTKKKNIVYFKMHSSTCIELDTRNRHHVVTLQNGVTYDGSHIQYHRKSHIFICQITHYIKLTLLPSRWTFSLSSVHELTTEWVKVQQQCKYIHMVLGSTTPTTIKVFLFRFILSVISQRE